jgi:hypothetical protein
MQLAGLEPATSWMRRPDIFPNILRECFPIRQHTLSVKVCLDPRFRGERPRA